MEGNEMLTGEKEPYYDQNKDQVHLSINDIES